jgi:hypothetical protein
MKLENINRVLLLNETPGGRVLTLEQLRTRYGIDSDGTNLYNGIVQANVDNLARGFAIQSPPAVPCKPISVLGGKPRRRKDTSARHGLR